MKKKTATWDVMGAKMRKHWDRFHQFPNQIFATKNPLSKITAPFARLKEVYTVIHRNNVSGKFRNQIWESDGMQPSDAALQRSRAAEEWSEAPQEPVMFDGSQWHKEMRRLSLITHITELEPGSNSSALPVKPRRTFCNRGTTRRKYHLLRSPGNLENFCFVQKQSKIENTKRRVWADIRTGFLVLKRCAWKYR